MLDLFLRRANQDDEMFLYKLVNEKACRENSLNTQTITYEGHVAWFKKILYSKTKKQYILMKEDLPVGQGRLELIDNICRVSYSIIPEKRGKGYGKRLICLLNKAIRNDFPECSYSYAEVLKRNIASRKIFEELGYTAEVKDDIFYYQKKIN